MGFRLPLFWKYTRDPSPKLLITLNFRIVSMGIHAATWFPTNQSSE